MSFDTEETSDQQGRPVHFVRFSRQSKEWLYTNTDQDIVFNAQTYTAVPLKIPNILQGGDPQSDDVQISLPASATLSQYLDIRNPTTAITVTIRKGHVVEDDATGAFTAPLLIDCPIIWVGELVSVSRPQINERVLSCTNQLSSTRRGGLRLTWGRNCPHMLYERGCFVDKVAFGTGLASITIIDGVSLSAAEVDALADGYFSGGFLEWNSEVGVIERVGIDTHVGAILTLLGSTFGIAGGTSYKAYPGCDRTATTCNSKFSNILNYGGINHMQGRSPFDGNPVF